MTRKSKKTLTDAQRKVLLEEYKKGIFTTMELAVRYGISYSTVYKILKEEGTE
jgi:transposase